MEYRFKDAKHSFVKNSFEGRLLYARKRVLQPAYITEFEIKFFTTITFLTWIVYSVGLTIESWLRMNEMTGFSMS